MSNKAYYFVKNFNFEEVMNLIRYATKHPETLTTNQKCTRLYRYKSQLFPNFLLKNYFHYS
jgi:hypothetical protein